MCNTEILSRASWRHRAGAVPLEVPIWPGNDPFFESHDDRGANRQSLSAAHRHDADTLAFRKRPIFPERRDLREVSTEAEAPP